MLKNEDIWGTPAILSADYAADLSSAVHDIEFAEDVLYNAQSLQAVLPPYSMLVGALLVKSESESVWKNTLVRTPRAQHCLVDLV